MNHKINHANIKDWAKNYKGELFDGILCDPPYELGFMGKSWDSSGIAFDTEMWADIFKLLKPGGHLLAFSGSRTYHRMAVAIEDAGFEIRDQLIWMYGSGFPKSLNIGKSVEALVTTGNASKNGFSDLNGEKLERGNWGISEQAKKHGFRAKNYDTETTKTERIGQLDPTTDEAKLWNGYGTALKPAHEPCVLARKPMIDPDVDLTETVRRAIIDTGLTEEIQWNNVSVTGVEKSRQLTYLSSTHLLRTAETYARRVKSKQTTDTESDTESSYAKEQKNDTKKDQTTTGNTEKGLANDLKTKSLTPTVTSANVAESQNEHSSRLTTSTVAVESTEKATTAKYIQNLGDKGFLLDTELFAGTVTGLTDLATPVLIAKNSDGTYTYPKELPKIIKGGTNTVANNVLKHGTGGLNIDGTRVGATKEDMGDWDRFKGHQNSNTIRKNMVDSKTEDFDERVDNGVNTLGRFPANLIHDGSDEVEAVFPDSKGMATQKSGKGIKVYTGNSLLHSKTEFPDVRQGFNDNGSASRFFYTAKASKRERNAGLEGFEEKDPDNRSDTAKGSYTSKGIAPQSNHHPTVKPLSLTKYLATLIKPPTGGRLLVPFSGSGSEMIGALQAGWEYVEGVELTEEYIPIAEARIKYWLEQKEVEDNQPQQTALVYGKIY